MEHSDLIYRKAQKSDISQLVNLRIDFLVEVDGLQKRDLIEELKVELTHYLQRELNGQNLLFWMATLDDKIISTCTMAIWQKFIGFESMRRNGDGYVQNVYTLPEYRGQGISKKLLGNMISEARKMNLCKLHLHTRKKGSELYESIGFEPKGYPELILKF